MGLGQAEQDCTLNCTYDQLFLLHCTGQGGIFPGNLGTGFPGNPWSQAKYLPEITLFLFNIIREEFEGGNQDIIPELFKINDLKSKELFHVK